MKNSININKLLPLFLVFFCFTTWMQASSHREAPLISNDPLADNVDLYAFRSPDNPEMMTIIATYIPMQLPHGGPNYYTFGENIRYEIHVDNNANVPGDEITYRFTFSQTNEDPTTFFNIRLGAQNLKTTYTLERSMDGGMTFQTIIQNGIVPPNNIGPRSIESAVGLNTTYATLFQNAITTANTGEMVFAGPTDDPFFVDLGGIFDLGDAPRQDGDPRDALACYNVSALAIQVPISTLLKAGAPEEPTNILDGDYVIGVWASASRPSMTTISSTGNPTFGGDWVQVSRLGMPLTNEAVIPIGSKDYWNSITPYDEITETTMDGFFYNPELALYMDDDQFGGAVPGFGPLRIQTNSLGAFDFSNGADGLYGLKGSPAVAGTALDDAIFGTLLLPAAGSPRSVDLWPAFHTGVPNFPPYQLATGKAGNPLAVGKPFVNNFLPNGGDMLRVNMAVPPTPRDDANFSSLGLIQAAAIGLTVAPFNTSADLEFIPNMDGFPNGRRLEDDVTRIELQAVAGVVLAAVGLWYDDYDPMSSPSPVTPDLLNVLTYTTGVEKNDVEFQSGFPYLAMPFSGTGNCSGEVIQSDLNTVGRLFVSSNTSGMVGVYDWLENNSFQLTTFPAMGADADGIFYDETSDRLFQLNRSKNVVHMYGNVSASITHGDTPELIATSKADFINGREIALYQDKLVVAQDANDANGMTNKFYIYTIGDQSLTLEKIYDATINLWGIHADATTLYAIEDNSNRLAVYSNFFDQAAGTLEPSELITIEGIVRTHGLTYDFQKDIMYLTDVGAASSPDDGAFTIVENFMTASNDGIINLTEQIRIEGSETFLGNPVDIAFNPDNGIVFIAERANGGGRVLGFNSPTASGNIAPDYNSSFDGASAVNVPGPQNDMPPAIGADLSLSIKADNLLYEQYEHTTYTITVKNDGPESTEQVIVSAALPEGMKFSDATTDKGEYELFFEEWEVGTLIAGEEASLELVLFTVIEEVDITLFTQVVQSENEDPDSTPDNGSPGNIAEDDEAEVTIKPASDGGVGGEDGEADLSLTVSATSNTADLYVPVTFTFVLSNDGPDMATNISVSIPKPDGMAYVDDESSSGNYNLFFEKWRIPQLASGASAMLDLTLFTKSESTIVTYGEVFIAGQSDPDSTPGNGNGVSAIEDDEAAWSLQVMNLSAPDVLVQRQVAGNGLINIFPNPTEDELNISLDTKKDGIYSIEIINQMGMEKMAGNYDLVKGENQISMNVAHLAQGVYYARVPELGTISKFVIVRK